MKFRAIFLVLACSGAVIGCTTISVAPKSAQINQTKQLSPITKMADALVQRFSDRGWAVKADPARAVRKFTQFLSRGLNKAETKPQQDPVDMYLAKLHDNDQSNDLDNRLLSEISLAISETKSLNENVDIYELDGNRTHSMRVEMLSLEQAVLATRKAKKLFGAAIRRSGANNESLHAELQDLSEQIEILTKSANAMNHRRAQTATG